MLKSVKLALLVGLAGLGSGCMSDEYRRADGLTDDAGEAVAANTVMQMVDPWQYGVQDTDLLVPADRGSNSAAAPADDAGQAKTMDSGSSGN